MNRDEMITKTIHELEVIIKNAERCNINCSYCYYFNKSDKSFAGRSPFIDINTIEKLSEFLFNGVNDLSIKKINIIFHGGEPLLQKKKHFSQMCDILYRTLKDYVCLSFGLQTNGMLVDDEWIELFSKYKINVGVSIDGPLLVHDRYRLDKKGKGTYTRVQKGVNLLKQAANDGKINKISALCVINPEFEGIEIYKHLTKDLGFETLDFLIPDDTHDSFQNPHQHQIGDYLSSVFSEWYKNEDSHINVRILKSITARFLSHQNQSNSQPSSEAYETLIISSEGEVMPDDVLRNTKIWDQCTEPTVFDGHLRDIINSEIFSTIRTTKNTLPADCAECCWSNICKGGRLINRHSLKNGFNNRSVYCSSLREYYSNICTALISSGVPYSLISDNLQLNQSLPIQ